MIWLAKSEILVSSQTSIQKNKKVKKIGDRYAVDRKITDSLKIIPIPIPIIIPALINIPPHPPPPPAAFRPNVEITDIQNPWFVISFKYLSSALYYRIMDSENQLLFI